MKQLQVLNVGGCGVSVVGDLSNYPKGQFSYLGADGNFVTGDFKTAVRAGHAKLWPSYAGNPYPGSCVLWADAKNSNGEQIYKDLLSQGEIVDKLECGVNATHGPSEIVVYFWYSAPASKKLHPKAIIRKIEVEQEQAPKPPVEIGEKVKSAISEGGLRPRVRELRGTSGTRVPKRGAGGIAKRFRFGWNGPKFPIR